MRRALIGLLLCASCATSDNRPARERCEEDARANYQQCLNPNFIPEGEPLTVKTSQDSQACRQSYQQALEACAGGPELPLVPIGTSRTESSTKSDDVRR